MHTKSLLILKSQDIYLFEIMNSNRNNSAFGPVSWFFVISPKDGDQTSRGGLFFFKSIVVRPAGSI